MKHLIILLFFTASFIVKAQDSYEGIEEVGVTWEHSYDSAKTISKIENKPILIFFTGSDWCGPCKSLVADFFESERFRQIAAKEFVLYEADFPRNKSLVSKSQRKDNARLGSKYGVSSYPTLVIVNEKEKLLGKKKGYNLMRETNYHFNFLDDVLEKIK